MYFLLIKSTIYNQKLNTQKSKVKLKKAHRFADKQFERKKDESRNFKTNIIRRENDKLSSLSFVP